VLVKSFSELLNDLIKLRWLRRGHNFSTQFADSIFEATRFHQSTSQAIGMSPRIPHYGSLFDTVHNVEDRKRVKRSGLLPASGSRDTCGYTPRKQGKSNPSARLGAKQGGSFVICSRCPEASFYTLRFMNPKRGSRACGQWFCVEDYSEARA